MKKGDIHPAVFPQYVLDKMYEILRHDHRRLYSWDRVLYDPMAGLGHGLEDLARRLNAKPIGIEIEPGYGALKVTAPCVYLGDGTHVPLDDCSVWAAVTSPPYPNGVCDVFDAKDSSARYTYIHLLREHLPGYTLSPNNIAGTRPRSSAKSLRLFLDLLTEVWAETYRVLKPGSPFLVNVKDTIQSRSGEKVVVPFTDLTRAALREVGFKVEYAHKVKRPGKHKTGLQHAGSNQANKMDHEFVIRARRPS